MNNPMNKSDNRIELKSHFRDFEDERLSFSVSSRKLRQDIDVMDYLRIFYMYCPPGSIESLFGITTFMSGLYGGRPSRLKYSLTQSHLQRMQENNIYLALTLTNHFFDEAQYRESHELLEQHHIPGNSIICTNDDLARRLKSDFPQYEIKASIIKKLDTLAKVNAALEIYDSLTLPMDKNDDDAFLDSLPEKHRMILFGNANCAYTCPARTCYLGFSQEIRGEEITSKCSKGKTPRLDMGHVYFDVKKLAGMGFSRFKLVPLAPRNPGHVARALSSKSGLKMYFSGTQMKSKGISYICSFPKCGRTWLRYIIANYLNIKYKLALDMDLHRFFSLLPNADRDPLKGIDGYDFSGDPRFPLILSSHSAYKEWRYSVPRRTPLVFLMRSIPDVAVSLYFQATRLIMNFNGGLKEFIRHPAGGLEPYCRYLNSWAPHLQEGRSSIISYEMLHRDTETTAARVLNVFNIPLDQDILAEAVKLSTFGSMRDIELKRGLPRHEDKRHDPEARRVRKGKVGGGEEYLDEEDMDYISRTCNALLSPEAKKLLEDYNIANTGLNRGINP